MLEYLLLLTAIPIGILLAKLTKEEEKIYTKKQYFPTILPLLFVLTLTFSFITKETAIILGYMTLLIYTWKKQ
jgi:ABC-type polysaccharide transport system permease subunit